jgi:SSS family solute:Na+ symporter
MLGLFIALNLAGYLCRKYVKGVADYLVAGRSVGRYLGLGSDAMQGMGAITILAYWQMNYKSGFASQWWYLLTPVIGIIVALSGWGIYRLRESRAMTLGQLIEMRYSKRIRIFFGLLVYLGGILNMGIFPVIGAGFFVYYCGLSPELSIVGFQVPTVLPVMLVLVGSALALCFWGGQVTVVVTDFLQSIFINIMLICIMMSIFHMFSWDHFAQAFQSAPNSRALLNPFQSEGVSEFNMFFFFIWPYYWMIYSVISWSPNTITTSSARDAHEAKMMKVMLNIRNLAMMGLGLLVLPLAAFVLMNHPDFAGQAAQVTQAVEGIANEQVQSQMLTPAAVVHILPVGMLGAFAGVVLFSFITSHDSYLLSWGSILIQDVVIPWRGKSLNPQQHIKWIRISVLFVALFIIVFSMLFKQVDNIFMFMFISASLCTSAAGVVLLGGIYWRRATTMAAWVTMITGAVLSVLGFIGRSYYPNILPDGSVITFWISVICIGLYVIVSYLDKDPRFDLNEMLNRKQTAHTRRWWQWASEVPKGDRILISIIVGGITVFLAVYISVCVYNLCYSTPTSTWVSFWHIYLYTMFALGSAFLVWITIGGIRDLFRLFNNLKTEEVNEHDDGSVEGHHAAR